jgi:TPP-dependent pyruvate/acetoin dehydrogenase alpha subunit
MRYMPSDELDAARQAEPVARYRNALLADGVLDDEAVSVIAQRARDDVEIAFSAALAADMPPAGEAHVDVYLDRTGVPE